MNRKSDFIPFALPSLGEEEEQAVLRVLRSGWLTTGKEAKAFEQEFAGYVGSRHALAVSSATAGLHLALEAAGIGPGSTVITTPYTFTATAEVIRYLGADPVFADIDLSTYNIDPSGIAQILSADKNVKGILPVHLGGNPAAMDEILALGDTYSIPVIEDAAHAFPLSVNGNFLGTRGAAGVFSFYATKTITTGEGGMVVTDNDDFAERIAVMRLHGIDREIWNRYTGPQASWRYSVVEAGYKYNMPDILAAIGREQLKKGAAFLDQRKKIADFYERELGNLDFLILPPPSHAHAWHLYIVRLEEEKCTINRDSFLRLMQEKGIGTSVHYIPLHIMPYYRKKYGFKPEDFPHSLHLYKTAFSLPIYPGLTEEQCSRVVEALRSIGESHYRNSCHGT